MKQYMHVESPLAKQLAKEQQERELKEANERLQAMAADVAAGKVPSGAAGGSAAGSGFSGSKNSGSGAGPGSSGSAASGNGIDSGASANGTAGSSSDSRGNGDSSLSFYDDKELQAIFTRTYGEPKRKLASDYDSRTVIRAKNTAPVKPSKEKEEPEDEYLLVDGYNIIFAWDELNALSKESLEAARHRLMDILCNYQGFKKCTLILVFDAYKIEGHAEEVITYHNIHVVYTKEAETADQYIEKTVHKIGRENQVTVATSDGLEQIIIMGQGAHRMSARGLRDEIKATENQIRQQWHEKRQSSKNYLIDNISDEMAQYMKEKRLGK